MLPVSLWSALCPDAERPMGCGASAGGRDVDMGIPENTTVQVVGESPHQGRTGTVKKAGPKKTLVLFMDKIDEDEEIVLKTKLLIATGPAGGVRPDSSSDEEEDPETLRQREKEQAQQRKAAAAKVKKKGKKEKVSGKDGRELEMERSKSGKVVIAAEAKHRSTKKKYQDRRSTAEKDRSDSSSKYKLNKVRTRRHLLQPPA